MTVAFNCPPCVVGVIYKQLYMSILIYVYFFVVVVRKKELLSRDDLELPWRPLYDMVERILYSKTEHLGLNWFPK